MVWPPMDCRYGRALCRLRAAGQSSPYGLLVW